MTFNVGSIGLEWQADGPRRTRGRPGMMMYTARICELGQVRLRDAIHSELMGAKIEAPDGTPSVIRGVESFATVGLIVGWDIGLLLEPA